MENPPKLENRPNVGEVELLVPQHRPPKGYLSPDAPSRSRKRRTHPNMYGTRGFWKVAEGTTLKIVLLC